MTTNGGGIVPVYNLTWTETQMWQARSIWEGDE